MRGLGLGFGLFRGSGVQGLGLRVLWGKGFTV